MMKIAVVIGSTRKGRETDKLAKWVAKYLQTKSSVELLDLRDYPMPFLDEEVSPRYNPNRNPHPMVKKWLEKIAAFDGYVFVTPEYNRATSAVLKNAIDVIGHEIDDKPVAIVAHGVAGGAQAVATLRSALPGIGAITVPEALYFSDKLADSIDDEGELDESIRNRPHGPQSKLELQTESLLWYAQALKAAR